MLEWIPNNGNKNTTKDSTYIKENMSEINDIDELPESIFPQIFKKMTNINVNSPAYCLNIKKPYVQTCFFSLRG